MYAHLREGYPPQTIFDHSLGVYEIAADAIDRIGFDPDFTGDLKTVMMHLAMLHDFGKFSDDWQAYLFSHDRELWRDHKTLAPHVVDLYCKMPNPLRRIVDLVLQGHHAGLKNCASPHSISDKIQQFPIEYYNVDIGHHIRDMGLNFQELDRAVSRIALRLRARPWALQLLTRLLHSFLVDGDAQDTERYETPDTFCQRRKSETFPTLLAKLIKFKSRHHSHPITQLDLLRQEIYQQCEAVGLRDTHANGVFSLEAPTGSGKTISAMAFALNHAILHGKQRIIVVLPYLSIIEQNAQVYRRIFGRENVVEHHGHLVMENTNKTNAIDAENWDAPIVVTTGVQFFESLFAASPRRNRKFHNIVNSVIIIDEAQSLPFHMLEPILQTFESLSGDFGCSFVLASATVPDFGFDPIPIIQDPERYYRVFEGRYRNIIEPPMTYDSLMDRLRTHPQALIVVNRRLTAQTLYRFLATERENVFCLTTLKKPQHRLHDLGLIRALTDAGQPCTVVSTSLIEAGVDIDFPEVWREQAGLGNYIQTQGRCNRHFRRDMGTFHIFSFEGQIVPSYLSRISELTEIYLQKYGINFVNFENMRVFYAAWRMRNQDRTDTEDLVHLLGNRDYVFQFLSAAKSSQVIKETTRDLVICDLDEMGKPIEMEEILSTHSKLEAVAILGQKSIKIYDQDFKKLEEAGWINTGHPSEIPYLSEMSLYESDIGLNLARIKSAKNEEFFFSLQKEAVFTGAQDDSCFGERHFLTKTPQGAKEVNMSEKLNSKEIARILAEEGVVESITKGKEVIDAVVEVIVNELQDGNEIFLSDLGRLYMVETKERPGRNPKTGESITVPAKRVLKFRPAGSFRKK
jgi:CRISPR-associated helicase Cas3/CRISPR-associated endonuclease Cas3-HD